MCAFRAATVAALRAAKGRLAAEVQGRVGAAETVAVLDRHGGDRRALLTTLDVRVNALLRTSVYP